MLGPPRRIVAHPRSLVAEVPADLRAVLSWRRFERTHDPIPSAGGPRPARHPGARRFPVVPLPGLGQAYVHRRVAAAVFAIPVLLLIATNRAPIAGRHPVLCRSAHRPVVRDRRPCGHRGTRSVAPRLDRARRPDGTAARHTGCRPRCVAVVLVLGLAVVIPHGVASYYAWSFYDAGRQIFQADDGCRHGDTGPGLRAKVPAARLADRRRGLRPTCHRLADPRPPIG